MDANSRKIIITLFEILLYNSHYYFDNTIYYSSFLIPILVGIIRSQKGREFLFDCWFILKHFFIISIPMLILFWKFGIKCNKYCFIFVKASTKSIYYISKKYYLKFNNAIIKTNHKIRDRENQEVREIQSQQNEIIDKIKKVDHQSQQNINKKEKCK